MPSPFVIPTVPIKFSLPSEVSSSTTSPATTTSSTASSSLGSVSSVTITGSFTVPVTECPRGSVSIPVPRWPAATWRPVIPVILELRRSLVFLIFYTLSVLLSSVTISGFPWRPVVCIISSASSPSSGICFGILDIWIKQDANKTIISNDQWSGGCK